METQTFVIKRKINEDGKSETLYFNEWMLGLPFWGYDVASAMKFSTKEEAKKHLPGLRIRRTSSGTHYTKGIKVEKVYN